MTNFQWRKFQFFDLEKDVDKGAIYEAIGSDVDVTAVTGGRGLLLIGDSIGRLHMFDRRMSPKSIEVFNDANIKLISRAAKSGLIVCVSGSSSDNLVKIYDIDKPDKTSGLPSLVRSTRLNQSSGTPTALAVDDENQLVSVGFDNGTLILIRGDLRRDRGVRQKALMTGYSSSSKSKVSISGLAFRSSWLYVATSTEVLLFSIGIKDREKCTRLDDIGAEVGLTAATEGLPDAHFAIACSDAIYFYSNEGRGQCYAIEGEKSHLCWFRNYLIVITKEMPIWSKNSADLHSKKEEKYNMTIFDIQNKFIAYSAPLKPVQALASEWGLLYGLGQDKRLFHLTEKDIQSKLDLLFKKNFYDIAIKIAKSNHYDSAGLKDIFRQYGDHLYNKGK